MSSHVTGREKTARCAHLLVKHTESRNPVSRRTGEQITMSKDHARRYLEGLLEGIGAVACVHGRGLVVLGDAGEVVAFSRHAGKLALEKFGAVRRQLCGGLVLGRLNQAKG